MPKKFKFSGHEKIPRWILYEIEGKVAGCEFALRQRIKYPSSITSYFLEQHAKFLSWVRQLLREHARIDTTYWYDLPPHTRRKPKQLPVPFRRKAAEQTGSRQRRDRGSVDKRTSSSRRA